MVADAPSHQSIRVIDGLRGRLPSYTNLTGLFLDLPELCGKQIEILKEAVPTLERLGVLWDSTIGEGQFHATQATRPMEVAIGSRSGWPSTNMGRPLAGIG